MADTADSDMLLIDYFSGLCVHR